MGILLTIDRCLNMIPSELIENKIVFIELDKDSYESVQKEVKEVMGSEIVLSEEKIADIGKCKVITFTHGKAYVVENKNVSKQGDFYFAFKTKII